MSRARETLANVGDVFDGVRTNADYAPLKTSLDRVSASARSTLAVLPTATALSQAVQRIERADEEAATPLNDAAAERGDVRAAGSRLIEAASGLVAGIRQPMQSARVDVFVRAYCAFHSAARLHIAHALAAPANVLIRREVSSHNILALSLSLAAIFPRRSLLMRSFIYS